MKCPRCKTEMKLIDTCCKAGSCGHNSVTHYFLEEKYWKCPKCRIEFEDGFGTILGEASNDED